MGITARPESARDLIMEKSATSADPFTLQERQRLRRLLDEDDIRKLAIYYAHSLDNGHIAQLRDVFTDDICCHFGPYGEWQGLESVIENFEQVFKSLGGIPLTSMHAGSGHCIHFINANNATGQRQLMDFLTSRRPEENPIMWLAVYDETYQRGDNGWRISSISVEFLWPERFVSEGFPSQFPPQITP